MNRDWLHISSNLAIIVGLIIVIFEIRQSHVIARTQLINDDYISSHEHLYTLMGENAADAVAKAKFAPNELTDAEKIAVDAHLSSLYTRLSSYEYIHDTTGLHYDDWEDVPPVTFKRHFDYAYARDWWLRERALDKYWTSELDQMFDEYFGVEAE